MKQILFNQLVFFLRKPRIFTTNERWVKKSMFQFGSYPEGLKEGVDPMGWSLSFLGMINGPLPKHYGVVLVVHGDKSAYSGKTTYTLQLKKKWW